MIRANTDRIEMRATRGVNTPPAGNVRRGTLPLIVTWCVIFALGTQVEGADRADNNGGDVSDTAKAALSIDLFAEQIASIEEHLARTADDPTPRAEKLVRIGGMLSSYGVMDQAAAAYLMALRENGTSGKFEPILTRLGSCLAPLSSNGACVKHAASGPKFTPAWRARRAPTSQELRQAVAVYEFIAAAGAAKETRSRALLALGWVHRALDDWGASTTSWLRCADETPGTHEAATALWRVAENLEWNGQPQTAARTLERFLREYPNEECARDARRRINNLRTQAERGEAWLSDPVASLKAEISERTEDRAAYQICDAACAWLGRHEHNRQLVQVSRWAATQAKWPQEARRRAHTRLASALLRNRPVNDDVRIEAAEALDTAVRLSTRDSEIISAGVRRASLLRELGRYDEAAAALQDVEQNTKATPVRSLAVIPERIRLLAAEGDYVQAGSELEKLTALNPRNQHIASLARLVAEGR